MVLPPPGQMSGEYLYRVVGELFGGSARSHPERVAAVMRDGDWLGAPLGYLYQLVAAAGWTSLPFLPAIRQPVLIVAGDDDPIIPLANARLMNLLIPSSQMHVYHGGHLGLATEAAELAPVVDAFLAAPLHKGPGPGQANNAGRGAAALPGVVAAIDHIGTKNRLPSGGDPMARRPREAIASGDRDQVHGAAGYARNPGGRLASLARAGPRGRRRR